MKRMLIAASVAGAIAAPFTGSSAERVDELLPYADISVAPQTALDTLQIPLGNCALLSHFELPIKGNEELQASHGLVQAPGSVALQHAGIWTLPGGGWLRRKVRSAINEAMAPLDAAGDKLTTLEQSVSALVAAIDQTRAAQADPKHVQTEATAEVLFDTAPEQMP